jgi:hypothetical protein
MVALIGVRQLDMEKSRRASVRRGPLEPPADLDRGRSRCVAVVRGPGSLVLPSQNPCVPTNPRTLECPATSFIRDYGSPRALVSVPLCDVVARREAPGKLRRKGHAEARACGEVRRHHPRPHPAPAAFAAIRQNSSAAFTRPLLLTHVSGASAGRRRVAAAAVGCRQGTSRGLGVSEEEALDEVAAQLRERG